MGLVAIIISCCSDSSIASGMKFHKSGASGQKNGQSDRERNFKKENIEYRIMNIACRRNVFFLFYKKIERSETNLRNSAVRYSKFYGSLFNSGHRSGQFNHRKTVPYWCSFIRARPLAKKTASLIKKETLTLHRNTESSIVRANRTR